MSFIVCCMLHKNSQYKLSVNAVDVENTNSERVCLKIHGGSATICGVIIPNSQKCSETLE